MVEEVMRHCKNYFVPEGTEAVSGVYEIKDGAIDLPFVKASQYIFISGSSFSDGVHLYPCSGLQDETFQGYVTPLAVPKAFLKLCEDIQEWQEKYGTATGEAMSPFQSESFGGYSYSKKSDGYGSSTSDSINTWQGAFASRLRDWRKI